MTAQSTGGPAKRVRVIAASDLKQNGGGYVLEGRIPLAVYGVSEGETVAQGGQFPVEGNIPAAVYIVEAPDGVVTGNVPVPMIAVEGGLVAGNTAIPVYVVGGSLGGLDPVTNLALAIGNAPANDEIVATWDAVTGATGYEIEYSDDGVAWTPVDTTASTSYALTSADFDPDAVTHYVRVRAVNGGGESDWEQATISGLLLNVTALWAMNAASGNEPDVIDSFTATAVNAPTSTTGILGNARQLTRSSNQYFTVSNGAAIECAAADDWTVAFWAKFDDLTGFPFPISKRTNGEFRNGEWAVYCNGTVLVFEMATTGGTHTATSGVSLSTGTWYFVVLTHDAGTKTTGIQVNGTVNTNTYGGDIDTNSAGMYLGRRDTDTFNHDGALDQTWFYKGRIPSTAQLDAAYNGGSGLAYPFS